MIIDAKLANSIIILSRIAGISPKLFKLNPDIWVGELEHKLIKRIASALKTQEGLRWLKLGSRNTSKRGKKVKKNKYIYTRAKVKRLLNGERGKDYEFRCNMSSLFPYCSVEEQDKYARKILMSIPKDVWHDNVAGDADFPAADTIKFSTKINGRMVKLYIKYAITKENGRDKLIIYSFHESS